MIRCSVPFHCFRAGGHYCGRYGWEFFNKCGTSAFPLVSTASQSISVSDNKQKIATSTTTKLYYAKKIDTNENTSTCEQRTNRNGWGGGGGGKKKYYRYHKKPTIVQHWFG